MSGQIIFTLTDNLVGLQKLVKKVGGVDTALNAASVTMDQLLDDTGASVAGFSPVVLTYVAGSDGDYEGVLPSTVSIVKESKYKARITAIGDGLKKTWHPALVAKDDLS